MSAPGRWLAPVVLVACASLLAWRVAVEGDRLLNAKARAQDTVISYGAAPEAVEPADPAAPDAAPFADFAVAIERPLFWPSRRPPDAALDDDTLDVPGETAELLLRGVVVGAGAELALLGAAGGGEARWRAVGEEAEGWRVVEIAADGVTVQRDRRRVRLRLAFAAERRGDEP